MLKKLKRYSKSFFRQVINLAKAMRGSDIPIEQLTRSIPEMILEEQIARHVTDMTVIRDACLEKYSFTSDLSPAFRPEMHFARRHVYRLSDVIVNSKTGACCTDTECFLESFGSLRRWLLAKPFQRKESSRIATDAPVTCINSTGYAHFIMEELPRLLWALKQYPDLVLICPAKIHGYMADIYLELRKKSILQRDPIAVSAENILVDDFVFTQAEAYSGFWHKSDIECLRAAFLSSGPIEQTINIYVSRRQSSRSFGNEAELEEALKLRGYKVVDLDELKFVDQIELFRKAAVLVAPHGAGLANIIWCSSKTKVLELFTGMVFNDCFSRLSSQVSCEYYCLWSDDKGGSGSMAVNEVIALLNRIESPATLRVQPGMM